MDFGGLAEGMPHVLDSKAKWAKGTAEFKGTKSVLADVSPELRARLQEVSLKAYRALHVRDYGRVDLARGRDRGDLRDRGERQLLPGKDQRFRGGGRSRRHQLRVARQPDRGASPPASEPRDDDPTVPGHKCYFPIKREYSNMNKREFAILT